MQIIVIVVMLVSAIVFGVQNAQMVTLQFLFISFDVSLSLLITISILGGMLIALLLHLSGITKIRPAKSNEKKQI